jgi:ABC-type antimicrobial peptide transport system ATPase subunit
MASSNYSLAMKNPSAEVEEVTRAGISGMISAIDAEKCSADLMINAALHILAAWVASIQTKSSAAERAEDIEELVVMLPSLIE